MILIGIDPGLNGAIVVLDPHKEECVGYIPMPKRPKEYGKGWEVDPDGIYEFIQAIQPAISGGRVYVIIERVGAMPGQGTTGMFSFGRSVGVLEGIWSVFGETPIWIRPQQWKRLAGILGADKGAARAAAADLYPDMAEQVNFAKGLAVAEAILIAHYGYQHHREKEV